MKKTNYFQLPKRATIIISLVLIVASFFAGYSAKGLTGTSTDSSTTVFAAEKSAKPELQFYVMSFCPYGNQMEDILRPVYDLLGSSVTLKPQYIFSKISDLQSYCKNRAGDPTQCQSYVDAGYFKTIAECHQVVDKNYAQCNNESDYIKSKDGAYYASLHGRVEANQNVREICAWNQAEDKKLWWDFVDNVNQNCDSQNADTCWQDQAQKAGLDADQISQCFNEQAIDLIEKEVALTEENQVSGSPTLIINGVQFPPEQAYSQDGKGSLKIGKLTFTQDQFRSPNVIKEAICASSSKAPKECKQTLDEPETAAAQGGC